MPSNKKASERMAALKRAKATGDHAPLSDFFHALCTRHEIEGVREQKILLGLPHDIFADCVRHFCDAAVRVLNTNEATDVRNYAVFLQQVNAIRERIDEQFRKELNDVSMFTLGDLVAALNIWLKESFDHISAKTWEQFRSAINLASPSIPMRAALSEETIHSVIGNTNEIAFAAVRLLNEASAIVACSQRSTVGKRGRDRLRDSLPKLISLAQAWNGVQYTLDKISYGEWRVESATSQYCKFEILDTRLELSRTLTLRREASQRLQRSKKTDPGETFVGKHLDELLTPFLDALLDDISDTYHFSLTTLEYWDLRNRLKFTLSVIGEEDDMLLLAARGQSSMVAIDYVACLILRWQEEVSDWLSSRISKRKLRTVERPPMSVDRLSNLVPVSAGDQIKIRRSLEEFCSPLPRKSAYTILDHPFFKLDDESLASISMLDGGQWAATVRSKWIRNGHIGHRYGHVWEEYLASLLGPPGWRVLGKNINLRHKTLSTCEIDLLIAKEEVCLVAQMKAFAGEGMNMYHHWKYRKTIEKGISQARTAVALLNSTYKLSDLVGKRAARSITTLKPIVLSTLNYFNGWQSNGVSVVSVSALRHLLRGAPIDFRDASGNILHDPSERANGQLTGAELLDFLDNPVDWRISQGTAVPNHKTAIIEGHTWSIPHIGTDGDSFEMHPAG